MARTGSRDMYGGGAGAESETLSLYLKEIGRNRPLTSKEEAELTARIHNGDRKALNRLILANLRFVVSVSMAYRNQGLPLSDLINEGNIGLIRAAHRFDEKKNFRFISYAVWWIRQAILQALADQSRIVRLPLNRVSNIHRVGKTRVKLEQQLGRLPSTAEIAQELDVLESDVTVLIQVGSRHESLDASVDDTQMSLLDKLPSTFNVAADEALMRVSLRDEIEREIDALTPREQEVVRLYFGIGEHAALTLDEIGKRYGLTRERVRQIKEKALCKLKVLLRKADAATA